MIRTLFAACFVLSAVACSVFTPKTSGPHNYAGAAMFAASGVAAAGVNRAVTGYCWSACPSGTTCDRESGLCEPLPCSSRCPADSQVRGRGRRANVRPPEDGVARAAPRRRERERRVERRSGRVKRTRG